MSFPCRKTNVGAGRRKLEPEDESWEMTPSSENNKPVRYNRAAKLYEESFDIADMNGITKAFQTNGFVKLKALFSQREIDNVRDNVVRYQQDVAPHIDETDRFQPKGPDGPFSILGRMDKYDGFFESLACDERFKMLGRALVTEHATSRHIQFFNVIPGLSPSTPPHQDALNFRNQTGSMINIWVPLSRVDAENGCLHYIPGSHRFGARFHQAPKTGGPDIVSPYRALDMLSEVAVHADPGDVLVHHGLMVHSSEANLSDQERWALGFPYVDRFVPVSKEAWLAASQRPNDISNSTIF